jgi:TRAP-type C4-dicarboxylate transport system substrate-binding protein
MVKAAMRALTTALAALLFAVAPRAARADGAKTDTIKIATLAPPESPWGQVLRVWQRAVRERTKLPDGGKTSDGKDHALDLVFFWNGTQGDEAACIAKIKSGQLDGAGVTAVGLAQIYEPVLVLQLPGLFRSWSAIDRAKAALGPDLAKGFWDAGFFVGSIGDVGLAHSMSKGYEVHHPADLRGRHPYVWRDDPVGPVVLQVIGGVTPVPLGVPEVLPNLNSGAIDTLNAPALAAEQLQWTSRLDHLNVSVSGAGISGLLLSRAKLESLSGDERAVLEETGKVASDALTKRIRAEDDAAFKRLSSKMTTYDTSDAEKAEWADVFKQSIQRLAQGTLPREWVERAVALSPKQ